MANRKPVAQPRLTELQRIAIQRAEVIGYWGKEYDKIYVKGRQTASMTRDEYIEFWMTSDFAKAHLRMPNEVLPFKSERIVRALLSRLGLGGSCHA